MKRVVLAWILMLGCASAVPAEMYLEGYGGYSAQSSLKNPHHGDDFNGVGTSSISLSGAGMEGGRIGYFLPQLFEKVPEGWIGVEAEVFHIHPSIQAQTLTQTTTTCTGPCANAVPPQQPNVHRAYSAVPLASTGLDLLGGTANVIVRVPWDIIQPYAGGGVGAFRFSTSTSGVGSLSHLNVGFQAFGGVRAFVLPNVAVFAEYKALFSTVSFSSGLSADYRSNNAIGGLAYHF